MTGRPGTTHIEFDSTGQGTFADCVLRINGEAVYNVMGLTIDVQPGGWVVTTVQFEGGPVSYNGTIYPPKDET